MKMEDHKKMFCILAALCLFTAVGCQNISVGENREDFVNGFSAEVEKAAELEAAFENELGELEGLEEDFSEEIEALAEERPYRDKHLKLSVTDPGYDVYTPSSGRVYDYRYGPSMILNDDGSIDAWFSSPGDSRTEYDYIMYQHAEDGGESLSGGKVVLTPTPGSMDARSVCDPDVFYYDGYYYMGYTSTIDESFKGFGNSVFIARSINPDGPYEKWNGAGWGGSPVPLIYFDGSAIGWGRGEPSFVVLGDTLYIYNTMDSYNESYERKRTTEVWTADLGNALWAQNLEFAGYAVDRTDNAESAEGEEAPAYLYADCDSWDVVYVEEYEKFLAICTNRRFASDSCLLYFESDDGIYFERVSELNTNIICGCHNSGIMGDGRGHIKTGDRLLLGYAYSGSSSRDWGVWVTRFAPFEMEITDEPDRSEDGLENLKQAISFGGSTSETLPVMINAEPLTNYAVAGTGTYPIAYYYRDNHRKKHYLNASEVRLIPYDESIISVEGGIVTPLKPGKTTALVEYEGLFRELCFSSLKEALSGKGAVTKIYSPVAGYRVSLSSPYRSAVRPLFLYENMDIRELAAERFKDFGIEISVSDENVCRVRSDAVIIPLSPGTATLRVSTGDGLAYETEVIVTE